jgi:hypothetical protein
MDELMNSVSHIAIAAARQELFRPIGRPTFWQALLVALRFDASVN